MTYYYPTAVLRNIGVSPYNEDAATVTDRPRFKSEAFCSSRFCAGAGISKIKKENIRPGQDTCPDCGQFLFWKSKPPIVSGLFPKRRRHG